MMPPVLQSCLPFLPWMDPRTARLPGVLPLTGQDWLTVDDAFAGQMAERDRLIATREADVHRVMPEAGAAAAELFDLAIGLLARAPGYHLDGHRMTRPDGITVDLDRALPLRTLGRLVQEDLCLMQASPSGHVLTGAILCFPASWTLAQKIGRPMMEIHQLVQPYTDDVGARVQRMFDAIRAEQPLWRMNYLTYDDPSLHQPRLEGQKRPQPTDHVFVRCERQCFIRLPVSRAVVFSIHTYVVKGETLTPEQHAALLAAVH